MAPLITHSTSSVRPVPIPPPATNTPTMISKSAVDKTNGVDTNSIEATILTILDCYATLSAFGEDIHPGKEVDAGFRRLVSACTTPSRYEDEILNDPRIVTILPHLQKICSRGEFLLESAYAERLLNAEFPTLKSFPYHENYASLVCLELAALSCVHDPSWACSMSSTQHLPIKLPKFAFIGCGPLPLTAFSLAAQLSPATAISRVNGAPNSNIFATFLNVDRDLDALYMAQDVSRRLGFGGREMSFCSADVGAVDGCEDEAQVLAGGLTTTDVLIVAALVGTTAEEKVAVIRDCVKTMRIGARIVVRTARGLRGLLYPVVRPADLHVDGVEWVCVMHPLDEVVNSVIVGHVVEHPLE